MLRFYRSTSHFCRLSQSRCVPTHCIFIRFSPFPSPDPLMLAKPNPSQAFGCRFLFANRHVALRTQCPPSCYSLSRCIFFCSASFVLLVDIPMEFQFPATALKQQPSCSIDSICFAQESMLRFWVESFNALVCDNWYAICAVILKKVENM